MTYALLLRSSQTTGGNTPTYLPLYPSIYLYCFKKNLKYIRNINEVLLETEEKVIDFTMEEKEAKQRK